MSNTDRILTFLRNNPRSSFRDLATFVCPDKALLTQSLVALVESGRIDKQGFGMDGAPFTYSVAEVTA